MAIENNTICSKDNVEECVMHSKSNIIEILINDKADEVIEELFQSLLSKYEIGLETWIRVSNFIFDSVHLLYYKFHKNAKKGGSYIDSSDYKNLEKKNLEIGLDVLYSKKGKKYLAYASKHNSNREKQVIFLMIPNGEEWYYLAVKIYQHYEKGIIPKNNCDLYSLKIAFIPWEQNWWTYPIRFFIVYESFI